MSDEQRIILQMLQDGKVTVEEAERLLSALKEPSFGAGTSFRDRPIARLFSGSSAEDRELPQSPWGDMDGICWAARPGDLEEAFETTLPLPPSAHIRLTDVHGGASIVGADVAEAQIQVLRRVRAHDPDLARQLLQEYQVQIDVEDGELVLHSTRPRPHEYGLQNQVQGMWIFYRLVVPRSASAAVSFQHGKVRLEGLEGAAELKGAHGDWTGRELGGPVQLRHEHGSVRLTNLGAGLEAHKSHGPLEVNRMRGDLQLKAEHSHVQVAGVEGSAELKGAHGDWEGRDLSGPVQLRHEHGTVRLTNLGAGLDARKHHGNLEVTGINGDLQLDSEHGNRTFRNVSGHAQVRHSHGHVELRGLGGGLHLEGQHAHVEVELAGPLAGDVAMRLGHSRAGLRLPAGSSARIDLATEHGQIDAPGLAIVEKGRHFTRVRGILGGGEHTVMVAGGHTNITLSSEDRPSAGNEATPEASTALL